jgi:hypothetical protein
MGAAAHDLAQPGRVRRAGGLDIDDVGAQQPLLLQLGAQYLEEVAVLRGRGGGGRGWSLCVGRAWGAPGPSPAAAARLVPGQRPAAGGSRGSRRGLVRSQRQARLGGCWGHSRPGACPGAATRSS